MYKQKKVTSLHVKEKSQQIKNKWFEIISGFIATNQFIYLF